MHKLQVSEAESFRNEGFTVVSWKVYLLEVD